MLAPEHRTTQPSTICRARRHRTASRWLGSLLVAVALVASSRLDARGPDHADARLQELTVELKKQDVNDSHHAATAELGQAEALRDKARSLIGERRQKRQLARTLDELEATIALASAKIVAAEAKAKLDKATDRADKIRSELARIQKHAYELEKAGEQLQQRLGGK